MIDKEHTSLSVRAQCVLLDIWRSNVYYCAEARPDESILANEIHELWLDMPQYGYRRIAAELQRRGHEVNRKRILRMMRDMCIQALYPRPKTTRINSEHKKYPYLLRDLKVATSNHVWATDITYIKLPGGFVYLVAIIDIYSRFIVSWSLSTTLETDFCLESLHAALQTGKKPAILNTDQGAQFTSILWIKAVEENGIKVSMDGVRRWIDNVFIERFWRTLKHEHVLLHAFETIKDLRKSIKQFIDVYNYKRLHQNLGYHTPAEVYFDVSKQA